MLICFCSEWLVVIRFFSTSYFVIYGEVVVRSRWQARMRRQREGGPSFGKDRSELWWEGSPSFGGRQVGALLRERDPSFGQERFVWVGVIWQVISRYVSPVSVCVQVSHVLYSVLVWCHVRCRHVLCSVLVWCHVSTVTACCDTKGVCLGRISAVWCLVLNHFMYYVLIIAVLLILLSESRCIKVGGETVSCYPMKKKIGCDVAERTRGSWLLTSFLKPSLKIPSICGELAWYDRKWSLISFFS